MAAYAVALVLGGGVFLALRLRGAWGALLGTPDGWVVLAKIALFAPMVGLGAFNRYRLIPETAEAEKPTEAVRRIVGNVRSEAGLGVAVLLRGGLLPAHPPAADAAALAPPRGLTPCTVSGPLHPHFPIDTYPTTARL